MFLSKVRLSNFKLPKLPYEYTALEPFIDKETMNIHHTKHHQTYITKLNEATKETDLIGILKTASRQPMPVRNNGGGHYNHALFWRMMGKPGQVKAPTGQLEAAINKTFGSVDEMKKKFNEAAVARFGSGWTWLGVKPNGQLAICSTPNQDNPLMKGVAEIEMIPILGLDVWEHAYYLKYQNRRPDYAAAWWNVVNWKEIENNFEKYGLKNTPVPIE